VNYSHAEKIKEFKIVGNERLANETIVLFSELNIGDDIDQNIINLSFKKLFETNYFKNLKINFENGIISIEVIENPIIQSIQINGVKKKSLLDELEKITKKTEKYPFIESNILEQKNLLTNIVRSDGFYFAKIETKYTETNNNSIDITYNINLGERAKIKKIDFIGNKVFKNNKLRKIIISEESKPWKFITRNKFIDENRIQLDISLLENYFKNRGYYDVKIKSSFAKSINKNDFNLIFTIDPGIKYFFNDINLIVSNDYKVDNFQDLNDVFLDLKNTTKKFLTRIKLILKFILMKRKNPT
jgi:outer membrane protein insertion porin family